MKKVESFKVLNMAFKCQLLRISLKQVQFADKISLLFSLQNVIEIQFWIRKAAIEEKLKIRLGVNGVAIKATKKALGMIRTG